MFSWVPSGCVLWSLRPLDYNRCYSLLPSVEAPTQQSANTRWAMGMHKTCFVLSLHDWIASGKETDGTSYLVFLFFSSSHRSSNGPRDESFAIPTSTGCVFFEGTLTAEGESKMSKPGRPKWLRIEYARIVVAWWPTIVAAVPRWATPFSVLTFNIIKTPMSLVYILRPLLIQTESFTDPKARIQLPSIRVRTCKVSSFMLVHSLVPINSWPPPLNFPSSFFQGSQTAPYFLSNPVNSSRCSVCHAIELIIRTKLD